jgi:hypothetical protein
MDLVGESPIDSGQIGVRTVPNQFIKQTNSRLAYNATRQIYFHPRSDPMKGIQVATEPRGGKVNGMSVRRGERPYDLLREQFVPMFQHFREEIRQKRASASTEAGDASHSDERPKILTQQSRQPSQATN